MIATPILPVPTYPKLLDYAVAELQTELMDNISWLTAAFGKAQRRVKMGKLSGQVTFPAVYSGTGDYLNMLPDGHLGNYCWLDVEDYQDISGQREEQNDLTASVGLVFWLDLRTAYPSDYENRTIEHAKNDVMTALRAIRLTRSNLIIGRVAERVENIYRGYTHNEIESQFLMFPYTGFRLLGEMKILAVC
jgi:hypothetical protein